MCDGLEDLRWVMATFSGMAITLGGVKAGGA